MRLKRLGFVVISWGSIMVIICAVYMLRGGQLLLGALCLAVNLCCLVVSIWCYRRNARLGLHSTPPQASSSPD